MAIFLFLILLALCVLDNVCNAFTVSSKPYVLPVKALQATGSNGNNNSDGVVPSSNRDRFTSAAKTTLRAIAPFTIGYFISESLVSTVASAKSGYPIMGDASIMTKNVGNGQGTGGTPQSKLLYNVDRNLANRICNYNRRFAEHAGYFYQETSFFTDIDKVNDVTFYDTVSGLPLFRISPTLRSFDEWKQESMIHGWPSFRDNEVVWDNVRSLSDGEMVSITGTHLGHNLPDLSGNRYCINLVSIAGTKASI